MRKLLVAIAGGVGAAIVLMAVSEVCGADVAGAGRNRMALRGVLLDAEGNPESGMVVMYRWMKPGKMGASARVVLSDTTDELGAYLMEASPDEWPAPGTGVTIRAYGAKGRKLEAIGWLSECEHFITTAKSELVVRGCIVGDDGESLTGALAEVWNPRILGAGARVGTSIVHRGGWVDIRVRQSKAMSSPRDRLFLAITAQRDGVPEGCLPSRSVRAIGCVGSLLRRHEVVKWAPKWIPVTLMRGKWDGPCELFVIAEGDSRAEVATYSWDAETLKLALEPGIYSVYIGTDSGLWSAELSVVDGIENVCGEYAVESGDLRGVVLLDDRSPMNSVDIILEPVGIVADSRRRWLSDRRVLVTDDEGRFRAGPIWRGQYRVLAKRTGKFVASEIVEVPGPELRLRPSAFGQLMIRTPRLKGPVPVDVYDEAARLYLVKSGGRHIARERFDTFPWTTGPVSPGDYVYVVEIPPYLLARGRVNITPGATAIDLDLKFGETFEGSVVDANDDPVPGCFVRASPLSAAPWNERITDRDGVFRMLAPPGTESLAVEVLDELASEVEATGILVAGDVTEIRLK